MNRYLIWLSFEGSAYCGWQAQRGVSTVQQTVNRALSTLLKTPIEAVGAGRTDTGVHARCFAAHFDSTMSVSELNPEQLKYKLNRFLPSSIAISKIEPVKADFHARYSALERTYQYQIHTRKDPFLTMRSWFIDRELDFEAMQRATLLLKKYNDFQCFSKSNTDVKTYLCNIYKAEWKRDGHILQFEISANRFLRNMVRAIVGTLVEVGLGRISVNDFEAVIQSKDRKMAGCSAPGNALYLTGIKYPAGYVLE